MELLDVTARFRKGIRTKGTYDCEDHDKLWKPLKQMGIPDHLTYLQRNLYVGEEATRTSLYGTTDWFKVDKGV